MAFKVDEEIEVVNLDKLSSWEKYDIIDKVRLCHHEKKNYLIISKDPLPINTRELADFHGCFILGTANPNRQFKRSTVTIQEVNKK